MKTDARQSHSFLKHSTEIAVLALILCFGFSVAAQATETFSARLTLMPVNDATRAEIAGSGSGSAVLDNKRLVVRGSFSGLRGPATIARIYEGIEMGLRGTVLFELSVVTGVDGTFTGEVDLTRKQIQSLRQGRWYIQINSETAPEGNLWGWLLQ